MADDWRLEITVEAHGALHNLTERMAARELEHDLETTFQDRLVVSRDDDLVFVYAGAREQAAGAAEVVEKLAAENGWGVRTELRRWHPTAEEWEDPDAPLPTTEAEIAEEHAEMVESERAEAEDRGYPDFEVRVEFDSHHAASEFADRLREEGFPVVKRWKFLLVGATDEDSANALADRLRQEAGPGATVAAEGSGQATFDETPPNPFAYFGGLGG